MDIPPDEIFPDKFDDYLLEDAPYVPSPTEAYLELAKGELTIDGYTVVGEPEFGGYEYYDGKLYLIVSFTEERAGPMRKLYPAP